MAIEVETKDCTQLGDAELAEMADLCADAPSRFEVGDSLSLAVYMDGEEVRLSGRAVRVEENGYDSDEPWRYRLSIALDDEIPARTLASAAESATRMRVAVGAQT